MALQLLRAAEFVCVDEDDEVGAFDPFFRLFCVVGRKDYVVAEEEEGVRGIVRKDDFYILAAAVPDIRKQRGGGASGLRRRKGGGAHRHERLLPGLYDE